MYSLQNQNWYGTWYYPTPKPEETEEDSTTKPNYNQNQFVISYLQGVPTSFGSNNPFFYRLDVNILIALTTQDTTAPLVDYVPC